MKPLFEMPELLTLNGDTFDDLGFYTGNGSGCTNGCMNGCNNGCDKGSGDGKAPLM